MIGYIYVADTPFAAKTDAAGERGDPRPAGRRRHAQRLAPRHEGQGRDRQAAGLARRRSRRARPASGQPASQEDGDVARRSRLTRSGRSALRRRGTSPVP